MEENYPFLYAIKALPKEFEIFQKIIITNEDVS